MHRGGYCVKSPNWGIAEKNGLFGNFLLGVHAAFHTCEAGKQLLRLLLSLEHIWPLFVCVSLSLFNLMDFMES